MPLDRTDYGLYQPLIRGADAGAYTLPAAVILARRGLESAHQGLNDLGPVPSPQATTDEHAARVLAAIQQDGTLPADLGADAISATRLDAERHAGQRAVLEIVLPGLRLHFRDTCARLADEIVTDHLRPAYEAALDALRTKVAPRLNGMSLTDANAWVRASTAQREAYKRLDEIVPLLALIWDAHDGVLGRGRWENQERPSARFARLMNHDALRPNLRLPGPWPTDAREYALWLVSSDAVPWLPTRGEEEAVWEAAEQAKPQMPRLAVPLTASKTSQRPQLTIKGIPVPAPE